MMGAAAMFVGASFVACSDKTNLFDPQREKQNIVSQYQQAFVKTYGQPAADQTWGFGDDVAAGRRMTRSNPGPNYPATSTGINANANEWADPDKEFGGWLVPDPLTEGQKLRVQKYFQANPNLDYEDPHYRHFFVQQVYKGKTDPGVNSTEEVIAADGSKYNSNNMNLLTVGENLQHINNFNAGTCSQNGSVLDNGGNVNSGPYHTDQIMLMVNIDDTSCFGYHDSGSSNQESTINHNDKAALVSAATIDAWAAANGNPGEPVVDTWNRSFMGFDLAIKEGSQAYAKDGNGNVQLADYSQAPESPKYAWDGEKVIAIADPTKYWPLEYYNGYQNIMKDGEPIGWLTTNKNFYIAAGQVTLAQTISLNREQASTLIGQEVKDCVVLKDVMFGDTYFQSILNLPRIQQLVDDDYLPVNNKNLTEWVKVGVSDGYFSDWIVTLTEAQRIPTNSDVKTIRIMAEDLSASEASDFDFNDVVFDVQADFSSAEIVNQVKITLWAAGGTLPLKINSLDGAGGFEVHAALGVEDVLTMTNTHAKPIARDPYKWDDNVGKYTETITLADGGTIRKDYFKEDVNTNVRVEVQKEVNGELLWCLLEAKRGVPACKLGVPVGTPWVQERHNIADAFTNFQDWVDNAEPENWYVSKVSAHLYNNGKSVNCSQGCTD